MNGEGEPSPEVRKAVKAAIAAGVPFDDDEHRASAKGVRSVDRDRAIACLNEVDEEVSGFDKIACVARLIAATREDGRRSASPQHTIMVGGFAPGNETPNNRQVKIGSDLRERGATHQGTPRGARDVPGGPLGEPRPDASVDREHRGGPAADHAARRAGAGEGAGLVTEAAPGVVIAPGRMKSTLTKGSTRG